MTDRKPLVAIDGLVYQIPYTSNLSVPGNVTLDYGNADVDNRALPRWGVPQRDRCAGTWSLRTQASSDNWRSVCWSYDLGLFCAVSSTGTGNRVMTSPDGITWTSRTSAADNG